jgi:hypothetical protein
MGEAYVKLISQGCMLGVADGTSER